jgi:rhodanese-related sulfurtransferase
VYDSIEISVQEAAALMAGEHPPHLLDVREDFEREICLIPGSVQLTETLAREILSSWEKQTPMIFTCHHGGRSRGAAEYFIQEGFSAVRNLTGGIEAWACQIDPSIPRY